MDRGGQQRAHQQSADQWRSTIDPDDLITLAQGAALVRVTYGCAWSWWTHGRLRQASHPDTGALLAAGDRPLFWARDVRTVEAGVRSTTRGRPRLVALAAYL